MEVAKKLFLFWLASVLVIHFAFAQAIPLPSSDWLSLVFVSQSLFFSVEKKTLGKRKLWGFSF